MLGGVAWERRPVDPRPGPRSSDEIRGGRELAPRVLAANPETATIDGVLFSESRMAGHSGRETVLVDITAGPGAVAEGLAGAAAELDCDMVALLDVGGDVIALGDEPGLASPLCDAVMLAAGGELAASKPVLLAVLGAGCDGELTPAEVALRLGELAGAGASLGSWGLTPRACERIEAAAAEVHTEASLQPVRCARGETGRVPIRQGRRTVELTPMGALTHLLDPARTLEAGAPLARAVSGAASIEEARAALQALGVRTELDYERDRAAEDGQARG